jgi:hypothetical protein
LSADEQPGKQHTKKPKTPPTRLDPSAKTMCRIAAAFAKTYSQLPPAETLQKLEQLFTLAVPLPVAKRSGNGERPTKVKKLLSLVQYGVENVKPFGDESLPQTWENQVRGLLADPVVEAYLESLQVWRPFLPAFLPAFFPARVRVETETLHRTLLILVFALADMPQNLKNCHKNEEVDKSYA